METLARKIAWQTETRKSIELRVLTKIERSAPHEPKPGSFDSWQEHYIEMAGKRYCDLVRMSAGEIVGRETHFWDGSKAAAVTFAPGPDLKFDRTDTVVVSRNYLKEDAGERMERPGAILHLHVGREPLHRALLKAKPVGTGTALGRECDIFLFEQVRWRVPQDQVYYLDRETGLPLRVEGYPNNPARDQQKDYWVWGADSLDKVGKYYIPLKSTLTHFKQNQPLLTWPSTVQSVEFDKDFPTSTFWTDAGSAARLFVDAIKKQTVHGNRSKSQQNLIEKAAPAQPAPSADLPVSWTDVSARVSMVLGVLVLVVGLALVWRQRGGS